MNRGRGAPKNSTSCWENVGKSSIHQMIRCVHTRLIGSSVEHLPNTFFQLAIGLVPTTSGSPLECPMTSSDHSLSTNHWVQRALQNSQHTEQTDARSDASPDRPMHVPHD